MYNSYSLSFQTERRFFDSGNLDGYSYIFVDKY
jgi:hypothetical protein